MRGFFNMGGIISKPKAPPPPSQEQMQMVEQREEQAKEQQAEEVKKISARRRSRNRGGGYSGLMFAGRMENQGQTQGQNTLGPIRNPRGLG